MFLDSAAAISIGKEEEAVQQALRARSQQRRLIITSASRTTTLLGSSSGASGSSASASEQWTGFSHMSGSMLEELQGEFAGMVIQTGLPFSWAEQPAVKKFLAEVELLEGEERMGPSEEDGVDARAVGGAKRLRAT